MTVATKTSKCFCLEVHGEGSTLKMEIVFPLSMCPDYYKDDFNLH